MGDPYRSEKPQKPRPQTRQWHEMAPEEKAAWLKYFKGKGPKPTASKKGVMQWED